MFRNRLYRIPTDPDWQIDKGLVQKVHIWQIVKINKKFYPHSWYKKPQLQFRLILLLKRLKFRKMTWEDLEIINIWKINNSAKYRTRKIFLLGRLLPVTSDRQLITYRNWFKGIINRTFSYELLHKNGTFPYMKFQ